MPAYWLLKSEPNVFGWEDLVTLKQDMWDGVRNYQARNNLQAMKKGDLAFFYHSNIGKEIVGCVEIVKEAYPDPTFTPKPDKKNPWVVVDVVPKARLDNPISLDDIKRIPELRDMVLVNNSRLSVQPVTKKEWDYITNLANNKR